MALFSCGNRLNCTAAAIIASVIVGVVAAFLRITAVITVTPVFLWVVFGIAVVYLAVLLGTQALAQRSYHCDTLCAILSVLLISILGTILFAVILLAIEFVATSVIGAILTGLLVLFFSLTIATTACFVKCSADCND